MDAGSNYILTACEGLTFDRQSNQVKLKTFKMLNKITATTKNSGQLVPKTKSCACPDPENSVKGEV